MRELSPFARAIVEAGRDGDRPTAADRKRVRAKIARALAAGTAIGAGTVAGGTALAAGKAGAASWTIAWVLAPIAAGAVAVGAGAVVMHEAPEPPPRVAAAAPIAVERARATLAAAKIEATSGADPSSREPAATREDDASSQPPAEERSAEAALAVPAARAPESTQRAAKPADVRAFRAAAAPAPVEDPLLAEARRLGEAQRALAEGDPSRALELLKERDGSGGRLAEERAAVQAIALCRREPNAVARSAGARFLSEHPSSPYASRVRAACGGK